MIRIIKRCFGHSIQIKVCVFVNGFTDSHAIQYIASTCNERVMSTGLKAIPPLLMFPDSTFVLASHFAIAGSRRSTNAVVHSNVRWDHYNEIWYSSVVEAMHGHILLIK